MATDTGTGNLTNLAKHFSDENAARELLARLRWPNGVACPHCGGADPYTLKPKASGKNPARKGLYKCSQCRKQFSITTGTVFESSHIPVSKWLMAAHLMASSKKGISAHQLHRMLGVTYRAAWFMNHRLRYAMAQDGTFMLSGIVEADETYVGGKRRFGRRSDFEPGQHPAPHSDKVPVVALVERRGRAVAFPVERVDSKTLHTAIHQRVHRNAFMMTDDSRGYQGLHTAFTGHESVNHSMREYVRGHIHTNTVEGFFSLLKRGIVGVFHHVSRGHLHRYCSEFSFRYNTRIALGVNDGQRAALLIAGAEGKRLTFRQPSGTRAA